MNNEELEVWKTYEKYKSPQKKAELIRNLKFSGTLDSLNRLSEEFMNNKSSTIRNEAIQTIEYLELKLSPNRKNLDFYDKLLSDSNLDSVINFWYKDFKTISFEELGDEAKKYSSIINAKSKSGKRHLRFKLTDRIEGILMLSLQGRLNSSTLQNLSFGFISSYRDIGGGYINYYPFDQNHYQEFLGKGFTLFDREKNAIFDYFQFIKELESNLLAIDNERPTDSKFFRDFNQNIGFNKELWFLLSLINVQKANGNFDKMQRIIKEGLRIQDPTKAGSGWIKYYVEKMNTGSNNA